jgi:multicomponent Na+:H+ antiporter subunit D
MNWLLVLPLIIPFATTILCLFSRSSYRMQRVVAFIGQLAYLVLSICLFVAVMHRHYITMQVGAWPAPFGITLVSDGLSALMILLTAIVSFCVTLYSFGEIDERYCQGGYYPAYFILLMGLSGAFLTGDLFNLYVWYEVILISSFLLLSIGGRKEQIEGTVKYAVLSLVATLILLISIAFLYGVTGTLNMADVASLMIHVRYTGLITIISIVFLVAFGMKAALFPMFFWLPASYPSTTYTSSAIFAALLSKVGVYTMIRVFTLVFLLSQSYVHSVLMILAILTLIIGILCAIAQRELRHVLAYNLISHIGYMLVGLALFSPLALMGSVFYLAQHVLVKCHLFLSSGIVRQLNGTTRYDHKRGLYKQYPLFAFLFFIAALSLSGIPPFSGFWPKLILIKAGFFHHDIGLVVVMLVVGFLTTFVMARAWQVVFLKQAEKPTELQSFSKKQHWIMMAPIILLTILLLCVAIFPGDVFDVAKMISIQLLHPQQYVSAVMGMS